MLIEKTFHVHQSLLETRTRLANVGSYRRQLDGVVKASFNADGIAHLCLETGFGFTVEVDLAEMPAENSDSVMFHSLRGNVQVAGMVEFFPVRENLTEVTLTLDYQLESPIARAIDSLGGIMDRFLNTQLRRLQAHFEGVGSFAPQVYTPQVSSAGLAHSAI